MLVCYHQVGENNSSDLAKVIAISLTQGKQSFCHLIARTFSFIAPVEAATVIAAAAADAAVGIL